MNQKTCRNRTRFESKETSRSGVSSPYALCCANRRRTLLHFFVWFFLVVDMLTVSIKQEGFLCPLILQSETRLNLMRAFAGESQARNRYTFAAGLARRKNLYVLESVFTFTADQERAHAKVFYNLLEQVSGQNLQVDGTYPVELFPDILDHLRSAQHNEYQEWDHDYAGFSRTAQEEGFPEIAHIFSMIAGIEKTHGDRFGKFAELLEQDKLFVSDVQVKWMCLNCGQIIDATMAPAVCPVCKHPQGYFIRWEMAPFE